jgi:hypothetical protein
MKIVMLALVTAKNCMGTKVNTECEKVFRMQNKSETKQIEINHSRSGSLEVHSINVFIQKGLYGEEPFSKGILTIFLNLIRQNLH